ncbi:glycine betaine ABC transporter substrate-binding protein [Burkholderia dolosa]|uniref:Glycine betaine ABC transporter substrate-binding protein n=1 Tax=Burkholderia dolosa TaxID=152500 RepID=A0A892IDK7_9BURK|nr:MULTISPECIES: glycine betaine ABC transporter substrate-binding protein [Burkholderia]AKE01742.1 glycine/betaine ABC transporter substrate-binding protein [Burkholderia cepacia]AJY11256.1 substrate binding domain of ABC-type glycine betaine transport system family protein [Burkholderia dolosa AU0158]AYZ95839.1 glycine/betaine ABC transporter substrate-binding protein [Burkholderia dolosa]EAY71821.1 ABC-type proline/glycine betaine transport systems periplasmic component [Burkholderia dolosa 
MSGLTPTQSRLTLVTIDLSFHRAASGVVRRILNEHGVTVDEIFAPHEEAFRILRDGKADMLGSAWLPSSHSVYLAPFEHDVEKITVLYRPYTLWGVPDYVPESAVRAIPDLKRPDVASRMVKRIQGINPGAGISRFSREVVAQYGLADAGYHFENGTLDDCVRAFEQAVNDRRWVVVPLWTPQYLHEQYTIRELDDPKGLLGGTDDATLVARKTSLHAIPPAALSELRELSLGNRETSRLDYVLSRTGSMPSD